MEYLQVDSGMDEHPDIEAAGFAGACVFGAVIRAIARHDGVGLLRAKYCTPEWIARRLNLRPDDIGGLNTGPWVDDALERCLQAGLLVREPEGLRVPGWERFYKAPKSGSVRTKEWRERQVTNRDACDVRDETSSQRDNVTLHHTTPHHSKVKTIVELDSTSGLPELVLVSEPETKSLAEKQADEVFEHWKTTLNHPRAVFSKERKRAVLARLKEGHDVETLERAVDGCAKTPHNMGQNDRGEVYDDLQLICRDTAHVERFARNADAPPKADSKGRATNADRDWSRPVQTDANGQVIL